MRKSYGRCVGCEEAIKWVESLENVNDEIKGYVLNRMAYEFDKDIPVLAKFNPGKYGHKYDTYSCGKCGAGISEAHWTYCPNCGFRIGRTEREKKKREEYEQLSLFKEDV